MLNGFLRKNRLAVRAPDPQALRNVTESLFERERRRAAAQRDALAKLAQLRHFQLFFELGLAGEHDLQKFLC